MPTLELEFEDYCSCGKGLCGNTKVEFHHGKQYLAVEPCPDCLEGKYNEGDNDGYARCEKDMEGGRMTLECRAAIFLEENHISGDVMVEMDHSMDTLPDDAKGGCFYLHDLMADFARNEQKEIETKDE